MVGQTTCSLHEMLTWLVAIIGNPENAIFSNNQPCQYFIVWPTKGTGGLQHHNFLIFDGKQHPENIWFHGC